MGATAAAPRPILLRVFRNCRCSCWPRVSGASAIHEDGELTAGKKNYVVVDDVDQDHEFHADDLNTKGLADEDDEACCVTTLEWQELIKALASRIEDEFVLDPGT